MTSRLRILLTLLLGLAGTGPVRAATAPNVPTNLEITGGAATASQRLPAGQAQYGLRVPLKRNAENELTVRATNELGDDVKAPPFVITQIELTDVVLAEVKAERLTPAEVKELVSEGTIDLADPENFNVSRFVIVLTVDDVQVPISVPVFKEKEDPSPATGPPISIGCGPPNRGIETTASAIRIPCGDGGGAGDSPPEVQIVPFVIDVPDNPSIPPIPGVIVIDGRLKTLKEFYKVDLILSNVSTLFTLTGIEAMLEVPEGALKVIKPSAGPVSIADLPPGTQQSGRFIARGDRIGTHTVTVHYGGKLTGLGIAEPIPVSGKASTDIEVRGAPNLDVTVSHPDFVRAGVPYDLKVCIENTDVELPALYTTFELNVGSDAVLFDPATQQPADGPDVRELGDLLPGDRTCQSYKVLPFVTGPIASCTAGVSANLKLNVAFVGGGGPQCAVGTFPSRRNGLGDGPTVTVVPTHHSAGVTVSPAVTALFSKPMLPETITTGFPGATFNLLKADGTIVRSQLRVSEFPGTRETIAILQPELPLDEGTDYTIVVLATIFDEAGNRLDNGLTAVFTTEGELVMPDLQAPTAGIAVDPPVNPNAVPRGQLVAVTVTAADNVGVDHVNLLVDGEFADASAAAPPAHFMVDTAKFTAGSTHELRAVAFDRFGNHTSATTSITVAGDGTPPVVAIEAPSDVDRGRTLPVTVNASDNGHVAAIELYLDGAPAPIATGPMSPLLHGLATGPLAPGEHVLDAIARDGAGNTKSVQRTFSVVEDTEPPAVVIVSPFINAQIRKGLALAVTATVTDDRAVGRVEMFLDAEPAPRSVNGGGFVVDTSTLAEGPHAVRVVARDRAGNQTERTRAFSVVVVPPDLTPPAAPNPALLAASLPSGGLTTLTGANGAVEAGAQVEATNRRTGDFSGAAASGAGAVQVQIEAAGGDELEVVAIDMAGNRSAVTVVVVPVPPVLLSIEVSPASVTLDKNTTSTQLTVVGHYDDASSALVTAAFVSDDPMVAGVTAGGLVQPGKNGTTAVTVTVAGVAPVVVPVTVAFPTVVGVEVTPASVHLLDLGRTEQLVVRSVLSDGGRGAFAGTVAFGSADEALATVTTSGLVTGIGPGTTTVTVAPSGFDPIAVPVEVEVAQLVSIFLQPSSVTLVGPGQTQQLTVRGMYTDGSTRDVAGAAFESDTPGVASVSAGGLVTSGSDGSAIITATVVGVAPATAPVTVKSLTQIALEPASAQLIGAGKTRQLSVRGTFSDASTAILDATTVGFGSNHPDVATVGAGGLVTSVDSGTATITATLGVLTGQAVITVIDRVADAIIVSPPSVSLTAIGQTVMLSVSLAFNDGTTGPPTDPVSFESNDEAVVTVDVGGMVTAVSEGTTSIDVETGTLSKSVPVVVDVPPAIPPPAISFIERPRAAEGDRVVVYGANFAALPAGNLVTVNGLPADVVSARQDELTIVVPQDATSGPVQVTVGGQPSNEVGITIYGRKAVSIEVTPAVDAPAGPADVLSLPVNDVLVRTGDRVALSSAPDTLVPLDFDGVLMLSIDGGTPFAIPTLSSAVELTALVGAGTHDFLLELEEEGGTHRTLPIFLVVGPDDTGAFGDERTAVSQNQSRPRPVTFTNLVDAMGAPVPDGTTVVVSTKAGCTHRFRDFGCISPPAEGVIANGAPSPEAPDDARYRVFTVTGGRIDVLYDPLGTQLEVSSSAHAYVQVLPATPAGVRTSTTTIDAKLIALGTLDSAAASRSSSSVIADGIQKVVTVRVEDIRDAFGNLVPDGGKVVVSTFGNCTHRDRDFGCIASAGGDIVNGAPSPEAPDSAGLKVFTVEDGAIEIHYGPGAITVGVADLPTARVHVLPATPAGVRVGSRAFVVVPISLSPPFAPGGGVGVSPATVLADNGDNRSVVTVTGITDVSGSPVPDGTPVIVSTLGNCNHRQPDFGCIESAGGVIVNGQEAADFPGATHSKLFFTSGGQVQAVYSSSPVGLEVPQTAVARLAFMPSTSTGQRIGPRAFVVPELTLVAMNTANGVATPASVIADNLPKTVVVSVTGIRDVAGNLVPDGAKVVASTLGNCNHRDRDFGCIESAGGIIVNGAASPELADARMRVFEVEDGQIAVEYDPQGVNVEVASLATARISLMPARPDGVRVGNRAFAIVPVTLSPPFAQQANVSVVPATVLADGGDRRSIVVVTDVTDVNGNPVPDDTRVAVSVYGNCTHRYPDFSCINSAEGHVVSGEPSPEAPADDRIRIHRVEDGAVEIVYGDQGIQLETPSTATARVALLPATPAGVRIGSRAFAVADVGLTSMNGGDAAGPGTLAPGATGTYVFTNLVDTSGVPLPDGTKIAASTFGSCTHRDRDFGCIDSAGGTITNGTASPETANPGLKVFTVSGGAISVDLQAPASGTTVLHLMPANPAGNRIMSRAFVLKAVMVTP